MSTCASQQGECVGSTSCRNLHLGVGLVHGCLYVRVNVEIVNRDGFSKFYI